MPRNSGTGVYTSPSGLTAVPGAPVESADWNSLVADMAATFNTAWPEGLGGTGFSSWAAAKADVLSSSSGTSLLKASNLSDLASVATARTNLGLTDTATTASSAVGKAFIAAVDAPAQRIALGLGTAATLNVGTAANNVVQLNGTAKLPAVDGSLLTNVSVGYSQVADSGAFATTKVCAGIWSDPMTYVGAYEVASYTYTPKRSGAVIEVEYQGRRVSWSPTGGPPSSILIALGFFVDSETSTTRIHRVPRMWPSDDFSVVANFEWTATDTSAHTFRIVSLSNYGDFSHTHTGNRIVVRERV